MHCSIITGELFAQKYMPDLGQDIDAFVTFHWRLKTYREQDKRICSPEFECGGHKWCVDHFQAAGRPSVDLDLDWSITELMPTWNL